MKPNQSINLKKIKSILPHRPPFLFLDWFQLGETVKEGVGHWKPQANSDFFKGHFEGNPIVPGVILCEALAQASGLLIAAQAPEGAEHVLHYLAGADGLRFRRPVKPGEAVQLSVCVKRGKWGAPMWQFIGQARVAHDVAAEAVLTVVRS
jgi:3-hydroxyacyl-[acyl-carrier-protein] dehydratase